ncbi:MAG: T9SS type A sorting domain-containing protein, partial [Candidatus Kapaibacterium sp.]
YGRQPVSLPIAYGFDGFAVYGSVEPDGSPMKSLDENHGHYDAGGVYHYHGTPAAPYMIGAFRGVVTEDSTHQVIPQPSAKSPRPATTPLKGAVITGFAPSGSNGYVLTYTLNNQVYKVEYSWTSAGSYTYRFVNPDGTSTTNTYKGNVPCSLPVTSVEDDHGSAAPPRRVIVSPNPVRGWFRLVPAEGTALDNVTSVMVVNAQGRRVLQSGSAGETFSTRDIAPGMYTVILGTDRGPIIEKLIIE